MRAKPEGCQVKNPPHLETARSHHESTRPGENLARPWGKVRTIRSAQLETSCGYRSADVGTRRKRKDTRG